MAGLKILITSFMCAERSGLEVYVRDLALELQKRGHVPIIYSPILGELAQKLRLKTIPVVDDLNAIGTFPDLIHGHHHMETMTALLHFPGVPAIYFCHNTFSGLDSPPASPRLLRYVAVDQPCYEKLVFEHGVPAERARLLLNFVDGSRFKSRAPLPARPSRALIYGNYARDDANLAAVREACSQAGMRLDVVGLGVGRPITEPEKLLGQYDIVFAKARAAAEALTVGTAVVVYCMRSVGPMVTVSELERLLPLNFGIRTMTAHSSPESLTAAVSREISRYHPQDAAEVSRRVRDRLQSDKAIDSILSLYGEVIAEYRNAGAPDPLAEARAAAAYIRWLSARVRQQFDIVIDSPVVRPEEPLENEPVLSPPEERPESHPVVVRPKRLLARVSRSSTVIRLKRPLVKVPIVGKLAQSLARRLVGSS
ncbi:MAG: hypothetical protein QOI77_2840 [Blastocatellia bacterium]|nr:hypothetical protein [Blastocatellia bacterium]